MELRLLGTTEVVIGGTRPPIGGPRQRAVLADLALHAGRVLVTAQLVEDLWGESPPASAVHTVEAYISRLRRAFFVPGEPSVLLTTGLGYLLDVNQAQVDALQFGQLSAAGREALGRGELPAAKELLSTALSLWRGRALADVGEAAFAPVTARGLENDRLATREALFDIGLRLGEHRELVSELERAVAADPLRERSHAQLMLALYRSGRQADALAAFQTARARLTEDLGIEPGRELRELERDILVQAPELDAPSNGRPSAQLSRMPASTIDGAPPTADLSPGPRQAEAGIADASDPGPEGSGAGRRRWRAGALSLAVVVVVVAAGVVTTLLWGSAPLETATIGLSELTSTGGVARTVPLPSQPGGALMADGSVWVTSPVAHALYRVDPATGSIEDVIAVGAGAGAIAADATDIWVANTLDGTLSRVSTATNAVVQMVAVGPEPTGLAIGDGSVWVADALADTLTAVDPTSGDIISTEALTAPPFGVAYGAGSLWLTSPGEDDVTRVQPGGGPSLEISVGAEPTTVLFGMGSIWVANELGGTVSRIDPATDLVAAEIPVGEGPDALAVADGSVWVANRISSTVTRVDPATNSANWSVSIKDDPVALTSFKRGIWAATAAPAAGVARGGTLHVVTSAPEPSVDPALTYSGLGYQFFEGVYDGLMNFDQVAGGAGLQVVPDLALAMPSVTAGGTVYSFVLRPRIRYSDGRLVQPGDFRRAIERVLELNATAGWFLDGIVGASACQSGQPCTLDQGITVSDNPGTVTFHLVAPDPTFLYKLTMEFTAPVPPGTPDHDVGTHPVPSTGPYMIGHYVPSRVVTFVRNPYFYVWSAAAEPAGVPDRIVWTYGATIPQEVAEIEKGRSDWMFDTVPGVPQLMAEYPGQVQVNPSLTIVYAAFNVRTPPFNNPLVRQAFSLVANRAQLVSELGGPNVAVPTCQIVPPGMPGYQPYCPFTVDPTPGGNWVGPDLAAARRLVAESGTKGMRVVVWNHDWDEGLSAFTVSVLDELGYRASSVIRSDQVLGTVLNDSADKVQATGGWWEANFPSASEFFDHFFRCSSFRLDDPGATMNGDFWCDPAIDHLMDKADDEMATDPVEANQTWAMVDREVTYAAPWAPLANLNEVDFLSARVSNYQYNPVDGVLLDQLSVRH